MSRKNSITEEYVISGKDSFLLTRTILTSIHADLKGIIQLLEKMGYQIVPPKNQSLDVDTLLQKKDLRERVQTARKLFSIMGEWKHPKTNQLFPKEATIIVFELSDEKLLELRWTFEITRYVALFGMPQSHGLFFFIAPGGKQFAVTAYTQVLTQPDHVIVRRLLIDLDNITRTDIDSLSELFELAGKPKEIVQKFIEALPHKKVEEEFFTIYHTFFQAISKRLKDAFDTQDDTYKYTQRLLGRIVFLYFLQRKGWLDRNKAYLKKNSEKLNGTQLFEFLYSLFEKLNTENRSDVDLRSIPFLNGSLFEKDSYDYKIMTKIRDGCAPILPILFDVLDDYNFTISESTAFDKEVAVDPELLGNIFESMLPETERGDKGTFYTHQTEMLFMAREGIRSYLNRFPKILTKEQIFFLIYGTEITSGPKIEPKKAREIKEKLKSIKLLDPAVGSGGFLLASLQVLLEVRRRLNGIITTIEQDYDMKLEFIEKCLFGVDIEAEAIELARLRLWLTLIVDESVENVRTLPNLDYNLYRGDSLKLAEVDKKTTQTKLSTDQVERKALSIMIGEIRKKFIKSHGKEKEKLGEELENALKKLIKIDTGKYPPDPLPFSYKYFFPDIFNEGGFDIVFMNPPYIRQEDIGRLPSQNPKTYKSEIIDDIKFSTNDKFIPDKKSDISIYFHVRVLSFLKEGGVAVVIASSKWLDVGYGAPLQEFLLKNMAIDYIFESVDRSFSAGVNVVITIMRRIDEDVGQNVIRFSYFKHPFGEVSNKMVLDILTEINWKETDLYRLRLKTQEELLKEGYPTKTNEGKINLNGVIPLKGSSKENEKIKSKKSKLSKKQGYIGSKWGNVWLRAPNVYFKICKGGYTKLRRFESIYEIKAGQYATPYDYFIIERIQKGEGKNKSNYLCKNKMNHKFWLEEQWCPPILREPEDVKAPMIRPEDLSWAMFCCDLPEKDLVNTNALEYIKWAETSSDAFVTVIKGKDKGKKIRISQVASVKDKKDWWRPRGVQPTDVFLPIIVKNRPVMVKSISNIISSRNFCPVYSKKNSTNIWLYLNSMVFRMFMELYGRIEGEGALQLMVEEYKLCPVLNPLSNISKNFKMFDVFKKRILYRIVNIVEEGPLELDQQDRKELDDLVLKELGFGDRVERQIIMDDLYSWFKQFIRWRLEKPLKAPKTLSHYTASKTKKEIQTKLGGTI